jgi:hypothetical protein
VIKEDDPLDQFPSAIEFFEDGPVLIIKIFIAAVRQDGLFEVVAKDLPVFSAVFPVGGHPGAQGLAPNSYDKVSRFAAVKVVFASNHKIGVGRTKGRSEDGSKEGHLIGVIAKDQFLTELS